MSEQMCECSGCTSKGLDGVTVKKGLEVGRKVNLCYHHGGFFNAITLKDGKKLKPSTGEMRDKNF